MYMITLGLDDGLDIAKLVINILVDEGYRKTSPKTEDIPMADNGGVVQQEQCRVQACA